TASAATGSDLKVTALTVEPGVLGLSSQINVTVTNVGDVDFNTATDQRPATVFVGLNGVSDSDCIQRRTTTGATIDPCYFQIAPNQTIAANGGELKFTIGWVVNQDVISTSGGNIKVTTLIENGPCVRQGSASCTGTTTGIGTSFGPDDVNGNNRKDFEKTIEI